ncbi:hypothetical protein LQW54_003809 [Pestalotiopsis sp. IQ-011]
MPDIAQDNSKWTTDQDGAIIKLKKDKLSWADIGLAIGSTRGLVRNRHKFLASQIKAAGLDPAKIGESWAADMRRQGQDIPSPEKPMASPEKPTPAPDEEEFPMMGLAGIVEEEEQEKDKEAEKEEEQAKQPSPAGSGGSKTTHKAPTASPVVVIQDSPKPGSIKLSGRVIEKNGVRFADVADSSSSSSEDDSSDSDDSEGEREEQKRFLYHEYWSELYPKQKTYEPDRHWTEGDCKVLAVIEAKDEALKYKRMQADFFNATGRMVSEEIIKHKMQKSS